MSLIPFILDLADELHEFSRCLANGVDINDFGFGLYTGADQHLPTQNQSQQQNQQQQPQQQPQTSPRRNRTSSFSSFWLPSKRHHPYNRIKTACCAKSGEDVGVTTPEKSDASSSVGGTPGKSASYSVVNKNGFQVSMNVKQFAPNELSVKTIDNCIVVEGRHDDKEDGHGVISRHFVRKYMLPKGYDPNDVLSTLSSDGILTVKAPPPPPPAAAKNDESNERIIEIQPTPGPTPVLVVSAKDTPTKETTKKLAATTTTTTTPTTSSSSRLECQLPEKRQKLDLPPESEESANTPAPNNEPEAIPPATKAANVETIEESHDVEMEKADEKVHEIVEKHSTDITDTEEIELEKKVEIIEQAEKQKDKEQKLVSKDETEKAAVEACLTGSNGDDKNADEKMKDSVEVAEKIEKINETPAETKTKAEENNEKSIVTKMEIDGEDEGQNIKDVVNDGDKKTDNTENVMANLKTADGETEVAVKAAAAVAAEAADSAKTITDTEKTNNTDTSNKSATTTTKCNNTSSSTNSTTTNSAKTDNNIETSEEKNVKLGDNGVVTGEIANAKEKESETITKLSAAAEDKKTVTEAEGKIENETAELSSDTTTTTTTTITNTNTNSKTKDIIDDVALLKAATADPTNITDPAEENIILTEPMDGITETDDTNTTTTTAVDNVECSLFAKKSHLGNGNNTTATPVVGTEEMAN